MKHVIFGVLLALGSLWPSLNEAELTNSVEAVVGLHENVVVSIAWSQPPLNTTTDEMRIRIYDSSSTLKYDQNHDESRINISVANWAAGTYTVVSTLTGFEEVDSFVL